MKDSVEVSLSLTGLDFTSSLTNETNVGTSGGQNAFGTSTPASSSSYQQANGADKNLVNEHPVPAAVRLAQDVSDSSKISSSTENPPEQNPLQLTNLAALDIWKSYIEEGEKSDNDAAQGYWSQFKEAIETSFSGRGRTERDDSTRGWANERALIGEVEKLLKDGTALTIHAALYLIETGTVPLPEKGAAHIRERARAYLSYDKHSDPGLITRLIRYTKETAPDSAHAKSLLDETFENLEAKDSAVQTAFAIYSLVNHLSPEAEIQQETQGHLNALQGHSSFKRAAEKFLYSLSPTDVAVNVGLMFVSGGLGNLAKLLTLRKFGQVGVTGFKAIAGATAAGFATETASLGTFNNLQQILTHDPSKMTTKDIADNYKKAASMIGFTKLFGNIGGIAAPNLAKGFGMATQEGLTLGGKAFACGVGHTAGLSGMIASSRFNQMQGWQQAPVGGENEALMNDLLSYAEFSAAQGLAHSAVDAVTQGKLSAFQQRQHQEITERSAKSISQIPTRLSPAMAAMTAGASILLAPELAHAALRVGEASAEGGTNGLLSGLAALTMGVLGMAINGLKGGKEDFTYHLRDYQEEASHNTLKAIQSEKGNGLIILPTGTGKTVTFVEIAKRIAEQKLLGQNKKTLVLVHRVELVDQAKAAFVKAFGEEKVSVVSAGRDSREFGGEVVVAGVQTLVSPTMLEMLKPDEYGLVIVDETHHLIAETWQKILRHLGLVNELGIGTKANGKFLLGVTATPDRNDGVHISQVFTDGILFSKPLVWFILKKYLLDPQGVLVTTSAKLSEIPMGEQGDYQEDKLGEVMSKDTVLKEVVAAYEQACPGKRALIFASSVPHAHALAGAFNEGQAGGRLRAAAIDGTMDPKERQKFIDDHKAGRLDILINFGVLTEGYDDPGIEVVMNARPTRSRSLYVQMIGRGLRPDPDHPERKKVLIIDVTSSVKEHALDMDLARLFGLEYIEAGLPPLDVIQVLQKENQEKQKKLDEEGVESDEVTGDEVEKTNLIYQEIDLIKAQSNPLAALLFKVMKENYAANLTELAWALEMPEDRLTQYVSGIFPEHEAEIRKDFRKAPEVLGVSADHVIELWEQSQTRRVLGLLLRHAKEIYDSKEDLSFKDFIRKLCSRAMISDEILAYRLWFSEHRDNPEMQEVGRRIEEIMNLYDRAVYSRETAKSDLAALVALAREPEIFSSNVMQEGNRRGLLTFQISRNRFHEKYLSFLGTSETLYLYTGELRRILLHKNTRAIDSSHLSQVLDSYFELPAEKRPELREWLKEKTGQPAQWVNPYISSLTMGDRVGDLPRHRLREALKLELVRPGAILELPFKTLAEAIQSTPEEAIQRTVQKMQVEYPELSDLARDMAESYYNKTLEKLFEEEIFRLDQSAETEEKVWEGLESGLGITRDQLIPWDRYLEHKISKFIAGAVQRKKDRDQYRLKSSKEETEAEKFSTAKQRAANVSEWIQKSSTLLFREILTPLPAEKQKMILSELQQNLLDYIRKKLSYSSTSSQIQLPRIEISEIMRWAMPRLGMSEDQIHAWSKALYEDKNFLDKFIETGVHCYVQEGFEGIRRRLESEGRAYQEDWDLELIKTVKFSRQEIAGWEDALSSGRGAYQRIQFPPRSSRPQAAGDVSGEEIKQKIWLATIQSARKRWMSIDGVKDKQRKVKEEMAKAGLNHEEVIQAASAWGNTQGIQQAIYKILFEDARFRSPKKK
jgi:superfamily II DNA or RNA helicase